MNLNQSKTTIISLLMSLSASVSALDFNDYSKFFLPDENKQNQEKVDSNTLGSNELFLGFEAPLFEGIQSQWGALVSGASMTQEEFLSRSAEPLKLGVRTIWSCSYPYLVTPFVSTSLAMGAGQQLVASNPSSIFYSVGAGFQKNLSESFNAGIAYSMGDELASNSELMITNHAYTHSVLLRLSYHS